MRKTRPEQLAAQPDLFCFLLQLPSFITGGFCTETKQNGRYNPTEYHWKRRARLNNCKKEAYYDSQKSRR